MTDDLSTRLLEAIDSATGTAQRVLDAPPDEGGSYWPDHYVTNSEEQFAERFTPEAVLLLCQAHREIVEMYLEAKRMPERGRSPRTKDLDHASAMGKLATLGLVLQALARGCGIEDGT